MLRKIWVAAGAMVLILAWAAPQVRGAQDIEGLINDANAALSAAVAAGDATAAAACYTADGQVLAPGMDIVRGIPAVEAFWKGMMSGPVKALTLTSIEVEQHGDTVIEVGYAKMFDAEKKLVDTAKYIVIWKRIDGKWKLHRDMFNSNTPPS